MRSATSSYGATSSSQTLPVRDYPVLRDKRIDAFLAQVEGALQSIGGNGPGPPSPASWHAPWCLLSLFASETAAVTGRSAETLWRLLGVYLQARIEPRFWYQMDDDERSHLMWVGEISPPDDGDKQLSPRATVINHLYTAEGELPRWHPPLPIA